VSRFSKHTWYAGSRPTGSCLPSIGVVVFGMILVFVVLLVLVGYELSAALWGVVVAGFAAARIVRRLVGTASIRRRAVPRNMLPQSGV
jgi:hypothetical protein